MPEPDVPDPDGRDPDALDGRELPDDPDDPDEPLAPGEPGVVEPPPVEPPVVPPDPVEPVAVAGRDVTAEVNPEIAEVSAADAESTSCWAAVASDTAEVHVPLSTAEVARTEMV